MAMDRVNEDSYYNVTANFIGPNRLHTVPTSVQYRIDCETTNQNILGWTSVAPDSAVTINVTADQNEIKNDRNRTETKVMTVQADHEDSGTRYTGKFRWQVLNLQGVT